jgi:hypothetical protein
MIDKPQQKASGTGIAQAFGEGAHADVKIGFTSEEIAPLLQAATAAQQVKIEELSVQLHTSREAVLKFLKILKEDEVPTEQLATKLTSIALRYVDLLNRLAALDPKREVRFPVSALTSFLKLDPQPEEVDAVVNCLKALNGGTVEGETVPFGQYHNCRAIECGRFLIVYTFDESVLFPVVVLLGSEYE